MLVKPDLPLSPTETLDATVEVLLASEHAEASDRINEFPHGLPIWHAGDLGVAGLTSEFLYETNTLPVETKVFNRYDHGKTERTRTLRVKAARWTLEHHAFEDPAHPLHHIVGATFRALEVFTVLPHEFKLPRERIIPVDEDLGITTDYAERDNVSRTFTYVSIDGRALMSDRTWSNPSGLTRYRQLPGSTRGLARTTHTNDHTRKLAITIERSQALSCLALKILN